MVCTRYKSLAEESLIKKIIFFKITFWFFDLGVSATTCDPDPTFDVEILQKIGSKLFTIEWILQNMCRKHH